MTNKYMLHLHILVEDDAYRQLANGFLNNINVKERNAKILPPAGGWIKVLDNVKELGLILYPERMALLLIDFDNNVEERKKQIKNITPVEIQNRIYLLGVKSEAEDLKKVCYGQRFEEIGRVLADECANDRLDVWTNELLMHNHDEFDRLQKDVRPFLFK